MVTLATVRTWLSEFRGLPARKPAKDSRDDGPAPCPLVNEPGMQEALCQARITSYL